MPVCGYNIAMFPWPRLILGSVLRLCRSRRDLLLENLVLRQQLAVLKRRHRRPRPKPSDKLFRVFVRRLWKGWQQSLAIVTPETVVRWHRAGFRLYWARLSRHRDRVGRKPTSRELRALIFQMVVENPTWGAAFITDTTSPLEISWPRNPFRTRRTPVRLIPVTCGRQIGGSEGNPNSPKTRAFALVPLQRRPYNTAHIVLAGARRGH